MTAVFPYLTPQQAAGLACIVCATPYETGPAVASVPVGVAQHGGGQVFACAEQCAPAVGYVAPAQLTLDAGR